MIVVMKRLVWRSVRRMGLTGTAAEATSGIAIWGEQKRGNWVRRTTKNEDDVPDPGLILYWSN